MSKKINIACLPVAGIENPYQHLMIKGLNESNQLNAFNGIHDKFFGIIRTVRKYQPDYLHLDWIQSYYIRRKHWMTLLLLPIFMLQIIYVKYFTKSKLVWTLHNIYPHNVTHLKFHKTIRKWFAKQCEWIRVFSEETIVKASKEFAVEQSKFKEVPEGDYSNVYPNTIGQQQAREQLGLDKEAAVLLSLGYIKPYKGIENLLSIFSKMNELPLELVIAGQSMDQRYIAAIKDKIQEMKVKNIHLLDTFIPTEDLQIYYNAADVVVLPFDKVENSGSAIMAMGFKKPIVAPKMGVLQKRLAQQSMLLYDNLEQGIQKALELDTATLKNLGEANYKALQQYTWKDFGKAFD